MCLFSLKFCGGIIYKKSWTFSGFKTPENEAVNRKHATSVWKKF